MENQKLYSIGEVIDNIDKDSVFVSIHPQDEGAVFRLSDDDWFECRYPGKHFFTSTINLRFKNGIEKRFVKIPKNEFEVENKDNATERV